MIKCSHRQYGYSTEHKTNHHFGKFVHNQMKNKKTIIYQTEFGMSENGVTRKCSISQKNKQKKHNGHQHNADDGGQAMGKEIGMYR